MAQFVVARSLKEIGLDAVIMNEQLCHRACAGQSRAPCNWLVWSSWRLVVFFKSLLPSFSCDSNHVVC